MSTEQTSIGASSPPPSSETAAATTTSSQSAEYTPSSTQDTTPAPSEQTAGSPTTGVQGKEATTTESDDPLAGVPSLDELNQLPDETKYKKSLIQLVNAVEQTFKPKIEALTSQFTPFESIADRFQSADDLAPLIQLNDSLFGDFERDASGQLVPAVSKAADLLFERDPQRAGYLWAESAEREIAHPETGQPVTLLKLALEGMREDPQQRAEALSILGGVEPSAQAPTWAPTDEQLAVVKDELKDTFRNLPYDEREDLSANTPEFINKYLTNQKFQQDLIAQNQKAQELQQQQQQRVEQQQRQQAENAGHEYVEKQFRQGFTEFANSIVERSNFIQTLTPEMAQAQGLPPEQAQQYNQQAEQINKGVGTLVAVVTAALSHPDTQWLATDFLKTVGVDDKALQSFDQSRTEFAQNARNYGELSFSRKDDPSIGSILSNSNRAMAAMKGRGNLVAQPLMQMLGKFFEMKATSYNATLNTAATARPPVSGNGYDPTTATPPNQPTGKMTRAEIERLYG